MARTRHSRSLPEPYSGAIDEITLYLIAPKDPVAGIALRAVTLVAGRRLEPMLVRMRKPVGAEPGVLRPSGAEALNQKLV